MANFVRRDAVVWFSGSASQVTLVVENLPASAGDIRDTGLIPGSGRSPGGGHDHQLQHSCLENCMDRGAWSAPMNGVEESWMWLTTHTHSKNLWRTVVLSKMLERRNRNFFGHCGSKDRLINMSQLENKWMLKWDSTTCSEKEMMIVCFGVLIWNMGLTYEWDLISRSWKKNEQHHGRMFQ